MSDKETELELPEEEAQDEEPVLAVAHKDALRPSSSSDEQFFSWTVSDEVHESFTPSPMKRVTAADGMPAVVDPVRNDDIPPLTLETLVCQGDYSSFVVRGKWGSVKASFGPDEVEQSENGCWRVRLDKLTDEVAELVRPPGYSDLAAYRRHAVYAEVEPRRRPCIHYGQQLTQFDLNPQKRKMLRVCMARTSTTGAYMSVDDIAMWACSIRSPRHAESEEQLRAFDDKKMEQGRTRTYTPIMAGDGESFEPFADAATGGIFGTKEEA